MTRTEKEIIELLKVHPATRQGFFGSTYKIGSRRVNSKTLEKMREKGLIKIDRHPSDPHRLGYMVPAEEATLERIKTMARETDNE